MDSIKPKKTISLLLILTFIFTNTAYPLPAVFRTTLRPPLQSAGELLNKGLADKSVLASNANAARVDELLESRNIVDLAELVASDDSNIAYVAGWMFAHEKDARNTGETREAYRSWLHSSSESEKKSYGARLLYSALFKLEGWKSFMDSVEWHPDRGAEVIRMTREVFNKAEEGTEGFTTTEIDGRELKDVPFEDKIDLTVISDESERGELLRQVPLTHRFAPTDKTPVYAALLGGVGNRYRNSLAQEPNTVQAIKGGLPSEVAAYVDDFKAALLVGSPEDNTGMTNLELQLGRNSNIAPVAVIMAADDNHEKAVRFFNGVTSRLAGRGLGNQPRIIVFVQPITPKRIPAGKTFRKFYDKDKESVRGINGETASQLEGFCDRHKGEMAFDNEGRPIFGPENHWDFTKYFMQDGLFLDILELFLGDDGQIHDVILRQANQDDLGGALGKDRPFEIALNRLLYELQKQGGLYDFLDEIDAMDDGEWERYKKSDEFRERLLKVKAAVIEGGLSVGYNTGGGIFNYRGYTLVAEKANIVRSLPTTTIQNANTITKSLLADVLMCGLRPKDIVAMIKAKREEGKLSDEHRNKLIQGVTEAECLSVPIRQQIKIRDGIPIQGVERDIHGPLGRAYGVVEMVGHSINTFRLEMERFDKMLLDGRIDYAEHQRQEAAITRDLVFVPGKHLGQWRDARRTGLDLARFLGHRHNPAVRLPQIILQELDEKTPEGFLNALQKEGYYLTDGHLSLVRIFMERHGGTGGQTLASNEGLPPGQVFASLAEKGHVVSKDFITPAMIQSGQFGEQVRRGIVFSATTNPSSNNAVWKEMAVKENGPWRPRIKELVEADRTDQEIYDTLFIEELVVPAMEILRPVNEATNFLHGYVSYEFRPRFTADPDIKQGDDGFETQVQVALDELSRLDRLIMEKSDGLHNFFIKVPATWVGIEAGKRAIALGININFTLIATLAQYMGCVSAYKEGTIEYVAGGEMYLRSKYKPISRSPYAKSVASDFVSRTDREIDPALEEKGRNDLKMRSGLAYAIGKVYRQFEQEFRYDEDWNDFAKTNNVPIQQIYWGSTGVKEGAKYTPNPHYAGPLRLWGTTNTAPPDVVDVMAEEAPFDGNIEMPDYARHDTILGSLGHLGIDIRAVQEKVYRDGLVSFAKDDEATFRSIGEFIDEFRGKKGPKLASGETLRREILDKLAGGDFEATRQIIDDLRDGANMPRLAEILSEKLRLEIIDGETRLSVGDVVLVHGNIAEILFLGRVQGAPTRYNSPGYSPNPDGWTARLNTNPSEAESFHLVSFSDGNGVRLATAKEIAGRELASMHTVKLGSINDEGITHKTILAQDGIRYPEAFVQAMDSLLRGGKSMSVTVLAVDDEEMNSLEQKVGVGEIERMKGMGVEFRVSQEAVRKAKDRIAMDLDSVEIFKGIQIINATPDRELVAAIRRGV